MATSTHWNPLTQRVKIITRLSTVSWSQYQRANVYSVTQKETLGHSLGHVEPLEKYPSHTIGTNQDGPPGKN